jgi:hypothetical protein
MVDVTFKDLCLDTTRPDEAGPFWRDLLGLSGERQDNGDWSLIGDVPERAVWVNTVPEPHTLKSRVHLDIRVEGEPPGTMLAEHEHWTVRADPDGLEWCAFRPRDAVGPFELCVDATDPEPIARWWAERTGAVAKRDEEGWVALTGAAGFPYQYWVFNPVPEPKTVKNRMHWDVTLADATVDDLVAAGAVVLRPQDDTIGWTVMADPDGNEFCAFSPRFG